MGWGVFFRYFSGDFRVRPSRVPEAGRGALNVAILLVGALVGIFMCTLAVFSVDQSSFFPGLCFPLASSSSRVGEVLSWGDYRGMTSCNLDRPAAASQLEPSKTRLIDPASVQGKIGEEGLNCRYGMRQAYQLEAPLHTIGFLSIQLNFLKIL